MPRGYAGLRQLYRNTSIRAAAFYVAIAILILGPLLKPGYILTVDMVFAPHLRLPGSVSNSYLFGVILHLLNYALPSQLIEKLMLIAIFLCAGLGMNRMVRYLLPEKHLQSFSPVPLFAGLLYVINPLTYVRFMLGQYEVLLGYALLPWFIVILFTFLRTPSRNNMLRLFAVAILTSIASIHAIGFMLIFTVIASLGAVWRQYKDHIWLKAFAGRSLLLGALFIVGSSYWLIPLFLGHSPTAVTLSNFTASDRQAFATVPGHLGLIGNVLALQGTWSDPQNLYLLPQDVLNYWLIPLLAVWLLVLAGIIWSWRNERAKLGFFGATIIVGTVLAVGGAGTIFAPLNNWLYAHISFFSGYRDTQKFAVLILISYAYLASAGLYAVGKSFARYRSFGLLLPFLWTPFMIWGMSEQVYASQYPAGWYTVNALLQENDTRGSKVLFLPWHLYMPYRFADGIIANPAPQFFSEPIVSSMNPEIGNAHGYYETMAVRTLDQRILPNAQDNAQLAKWLTGLHISYIIVAKDYDYKSYAYLNRKPGLGVVFQDNSIILYKVE